MNGETYLEFLRNTLPGLLAESLEDVPLQYRREIWYMHDGAPPHRSRKVTDYLNRSFENWIGLNSPLVQWPARSPDLTPCDFSIWGWAKSLVYSEEIVSRDQLRQKIEDAFTIMKTKEGELKKATEHVLKRAQLCLDNEGGHFENYL